MTITTPTVAEDWIPIACETLRLNGDVVDSFSLGVSLAGLRHTVAVVDLEGEVSTEQVEIEFAVADDVDLSAVDALLLNLVLSQLLTIGTIQSFIDGTEKYRTAERYRNGIATYLYGVLARNGSRDSGLKPDEYRSRFEEAAVLLDTFDRPAADAICGLVAFHFNHFDQVMQQTRSPGVAWAAARLSDLLAGINVDSECGVAPGLSGLDFVLSDADLERVLSWTALPLGESGPTIIEEMEAALSSLEGFDQLKVRVLCAEHARRLGLFERGLIHANELRHNPVTAEWAREYVTAVRTSEDEQ